VACLFCGKEIGPIRILRDSEFCTSKHRNEYKERLQRVLLQNNEAAAAPTRMAAFMETSPAREGNPQRSVAAFDFGTDHTIHVAFSWTLTVPPVLGSRFAALPPEARQAAAAPATGIHPATATRLFADRSLATFTTLPQAAGAAGLRSVPLFSHAGLDYPAARQTADATRYAGEGPMARALSASALPGLALAAAEYEPFVEAAEPMAPPAPCEECVAIPEAEAVECEVRPGFASALSPVITLRLPRNWQKSGVRLTSIETTLPAPAPQPVECEVSPHSSLLPLTAAGTRCELPGLAAVAAPYAAVNATAEGWIHIPESEPVTRNVHASETLSPLAFKTAPPRIASFRMELAGETSGTLSTPRLCATGQTPAPVPAQTPRVAAAYSPVTLAASPSLLLNQFEVRPRVAETVCAPAGFETKVPAAAAPEARLPNGDAAVLKPISTLRPAVPTTDAERPEPVIPEGQLISLEYHCIRGRGLCRAGLAWITPIIDLTMTPFGVRPFFETVEDVKDRDSDKKKPNIAEIFSISDAARFRRSVVAQHAAKAIAASVLVAIGLWFGSHTASLGRRVVNRDASADVAVLNNPGSSAGGTGRVPGASHLTPVAWARTVIGKRAASEVTDTFKAGMVAWGAPAKGWAPGWSHHPDGYVRPGQLALFHPSLAYADYRLEFFGQIENKGMGWVVRAHDQQNFYAMKFNVVEPGLRPILSMVHYPVVGGKQGHKTEVPLSVMVHNNTAYHVAVQVKGNRFITSIEGQEVDNWTDDTLPSGGVGFFSEAGERARLYWMKVSRNDDWLGRMCAFLSGNSVEESSETAWLERTLPGDSRPTPMPARNAPENWEAVLAADAGEQSFAGAPRGRAANNGRVRLWSS
jgi:hypothetical protein